MNRLRSELVDLSLLDGRRSGARENRMCAGNLDARNRCSSLPQRQDSRLKLRFYGSKLAVTQSCLRTRARHGRFRWCDDDLSGHPLAVQQAEEVVGARRRTLGDLQRELLVSVEPAAVVERLLAGECRLGFLRALLLPGCAGVEIARVRRGLNGITRTARQEGWKLRVCRDHRLRRILLLLRRQFLEGAQDVVGERAQRDRVRLPDAHLVEHHGIACMHAHDVGEVREERFVGGRVVPVDEDVERLCRMLGPTATGGCDDSGSDDEPEQSPPSTRLRQRTCLLSSSGRRRSIPELLQTFKSRQRGPVRRTSRRGVRTKACRL